MNRVVQGVTTGLVLMLGLGACGTSEYRLASSRAPLPPAPLAGPCWPLPKAARFTFGYQVVKQYRSLDDTRWILTLQWDDLSARAVRDRIEASLVAGGFTAAGLREGWRVMSHPGGDDVAFRVEPLPGVAPDALVKGTVRLDLPIQAAHGRRGGRCTPIAFASPVPMPDSVFRSVGP